MNKVRAYLDLVRLPNLFTAMADIVAGFAYGGGDTSQSAILLKLVASSVCLYAGGVTLNDVWDARVDALERPHRPIPSNRVPIRSARRLALVLLAAGVAFAASVSVTTGLVAFALCVCIALYDGPLKRTVVAPGVMGLCRSLNFCLPLVVLTAPGDNWTQLLPAVVIWVYVTSLTGFAQGEATRKSRPALAIWTTGLCLATATLVGLHWTIPEVYDAYLAGVGALVLTVLYFGVRAVQNPEPRRIQSSVGVFVVMLIGVDMCIAWASRGNAFALAVAALFIPTLLLGSRRVGLRIT